MVVAETSVGSPGCRGDRINLSLPVSSGTLGTGGNITPLSGRMHAEERALQRAGSVVSDRGETHGVFKTAISWKRIH